MMEANRSSGEPEAAVALEININHRYKAEEMGVIEFRVRNQSNRPLKTLDLIVDCPCEKSTRKSYSMKNLTSSAEKKPSFQFEPARGGEALLEIEIRLEDENRVPSVFRGQTSVTISSKNEGTASHTSFNIEFNDVQKFMGNDLSGILAGAGKGAISEERLHERMERKEPFWMRVDLDFDEHETTGRRAALRQILTPASGQMPPRTARALMESLDTEAPRRVFIYSMPEVVFGREPQRSDAVLRFLPDFFNDPRSKTISGEQFVIRCQQGECTLGMSPRGRALMSVNQRLAREGEQIPLAGTADLKIGPCELALKILCLPRAENQQWQRSWQELVMSDPGPDPFEVARWDLITFTRPTNGSEEEYLWLLRKAEIGWDAGAAASLHMGAPVIPRARLAFWNGRYYLESLGATSDIVVGNANLPAGKIACLGADTEIAFGPLRFMWRLL